MKKFLFAIGILFTSFYSFSQTGIIRGKVTDKQSEKELSGATITILGLKIQTVSDQNGQFKLADVPLGRQTAQISFTGYELITIPDLEITSGKEAIINIGLTEKFDTLDEVVITSGNSKIKPLNKMAAVSTRQFSVEEVNRYAGGRSDVARLVSNFAGVSTADDSRNDIVIRGNSPSGLLWKLEGIPIPSPNHFGTLGTTGSPVSALNPNMLANSDFMTSAFPAEYGNALSGVFDLSLRKGNTENYEFTAGIGAFPGAEFLAEGPIGKNGGSFLVGARYGVIGLLGLAGTSAQPNYSDISLNLDFGKTRLGNFSLFGIYGTSDIDFYGDDIDDSDLFAAKDEDSFVKSGFYSIGLKHTIDIGQQSYLKTIIGASSSESKYSADRYYNLNMPTETKIGFTDSDNTESRVSFSSLFNSKISRKFTLRTGILWEAFSLDSNVSDRDRQADNDGDGYPDYVNLIDPNGSYQVLQPYAQGQYRLSDKLTINAGFHTQYFSINQQFVVEPRTALTFAVSPKSTINIGYGIHHQNVAAPILFLNENVNGQMIQTNKDLDLVRSQHYVMGYDWKFAEKWRAKAEVYYQTIGNAAVERTPSSYSSLTEGASFTFSTDKHSLISEGTGHNSGIELTIEKFFSKGYHALFTGSFFESKYEGSDQIERNTPFNNKYVFNALGGKEFKVGKSKINIFSINAKLTAAGGRYATPVDLPASQAAGFEITDDSRAFSQQYDAYLRMDLRFGMKLNSKKKKSSHQFYIELQNLTDNKNVFVKQYNRITNRVDQKDQIGFQPDFGYRFQF